MKRANHVLNKTIIDELGRIILPKEVRDILNIDVEDNVIIEITEEVIILTKVNKECVLCGKATELVNIKHKHICFNCIDELKLYNFEFI